MTPAQKLENFGTKAEYYGDKKVAKEPNVATGGSGMTIKEKNLSATGLNAKQKFEQFGTVPSNQAVTSKTGMTPAQKLANFGTKAEHYGSKTAP